MLVPLQLTVFWETTQNETKQNETKQNELLEDSNDV